MKRFAYLLAALLFMFAFVPGVARAGTTDNLAGWAWSSNIGWISFNCTNTNSCSSVDYGVNVGSTGTTTGYAWSSNVGWIQFGNLSGFPAGSGTQAQNANLNGNNFKGWARALSYTTAGDGWDGWIALAGSTADNNSYGVKVSGNVVSGYAWGSNVLGWINFDTTDTTGAPAACAGLCYVSLTNVATIDAQLNGSSISGSATVAYGSDPTISWTISNLPSNAQCTVSETSGSTPFSPVTTTTTGSASAGALTQGGYTYQIQCAQSGTTIASNSVSFTVTAPPPGFSISGPNTEDIQFLGSNGADGVSETYFVDNGGTSYSNPVTVSVTGISPALPSGVTATYSFNGGAFSANPAPVTISSPYSAGFSFQTHLSAPIGTSTQYIVTLTGTGSGAPNATKTITIVPVSSNPSYQER